jgi:opacity protein-like surface antigen
MQLLLAFLVLPSIPGQAQTVLDLTHREWEVSIFGGGSFLGSGTYVTPVSGSNQQSSRTVGLSYAAGSQMGFRITDNRWRHFGATAEYGFSNQPLTFTNLSDSTPSLGLGHAIHRVAYDVLYYPRNRDFRMRPYVFAGPGVSLFYIKGSAKQAASAQGIGLSDPWKFTMNWGGGVKYLLADHIAASLQFSDSISGVPSYGLPAAGSVVSGRYVPGFQPDGLLHNWLISFGFIYQWSDR